MKDYIYLDEDLLNSTLAQLDSGLLQGFSESDEQGSSHSDTSEENLSKGLEGVLQVGARYVKEVTDKSGIELTKSQTRALDYALNDYAVDVLLEKIKDFDNYTDEILDSKEGELINFQSNFSLYDFSLIKEITDDIMIDIFFGDAVKSDKVKELETKIKSIKPQSRKNAQLKEKVNDLETQLKFHKQEQIAGAEGFKLINKAATAAEKILGESIFIKTDSSLSLCKKEYFRLNKGQLALLTETNRKTNVLGLVTAVKTKTHEDQLKNFSEQDMNKIPSMFTDMFLTSFNMLDKEDRIITPIAIFFE